MKITAEQYVPLAMSTCSDGFHPHLVAPQLLHASMGLVTEAGEFQDALKRALFYGKPLDPVNLIEELGDVAWYIAIACDHLGVSLEETFGINIAKLKKRFPDKFTQHAALFRDLEGEYEALKEGVSA